MTRRLVTPFVAPLFGFLMLLAACQPKSDTSSTDPESGRGGSNGTSSGGRAGSSASGGDSGTGGSAASGGSSGTASGGAGGAVTGSGGDSGGGGSGGDNGSGGASGAGGSSGSPDAPVAIDSPSASDGPAVGAGDAFGAEGDHLPGREDLKICRKEWSAAKCCEFLCSCLTNICSDSAKGKPGLATCMSWCPKLGDMARRCHVYHCFVSISPTGGLKDHDSHCGHAADQVQGGGCPVEAYQ
jgi:hypothetical protein